MATSVKTTGSKSSTPGVKTIQIDTNQLPTLLIPDDEPVDNEDENDHQAKDMIGFSTPMYFVEENEAFAMIDVVGCLDMKGRK